MEVHSSNLAVSPLSMHVYETSVNDLIQVKLFA
jgi:hypothetical protein